MTRARRGEARRGEGASVFLARRNPIDPRDSLETDSRRYRKKILEKLAKHLWPLKTFVALVEDARVYKEHSYALQSDTYLLVLRGVEKQY
ncbi:hypothetical protein E2C01_000109 [Portunus trituberculatus]|uniref:Uncharacterized protein n=1 Tax=Portunus trituberculatus TaxID=210409 RepID=A0A5B7CGE6_PORTR|nr:hypothetical protein [Portunus trituberculatus]